MGDVLRLEDRNTTTRLTFPLTGLYAQRQLSGAAAAYWQVDSLPASGSSHRERLHHLRAACAPSPAFSAALAAASGTWVAEPDMGAFTGSQLSAVSAAVRRSKAR